jgi:drug/metabolite transporter (DMT)-like permease
MVVPGQPPAATRATWAGTAAAVTVVLWASAYAVTRLVGREISPGPLALARLLTGSAVLGLLLLRRPLRRPARRDWLPLFAVGVVWFGGYNLATNTAVRFVDAGTAGMVVNTGPLLIALLAGAVLDEGYPLQVVTGAAVGFAGVVLIGLTSAGSAEAVGVLLCVVAAVTWAVGVVSQKPVLGRLSALQVTWIGCTLGAVVCLPFAGELARETAAAAPATVAWTAYLGVFPTAVAFTTWAYALSRTTAGRLAATMYLLPPLGIVEAWLLLGETPALPAFAGGALCLTGVYLARRRGRTAA